MCQSALLVQLLMVGHFHAIPCTRVGVDSSAHISTDSESEDASPTGDIFGRLSGENDINKLKINFYSGNEGSKGAESLSEEYKDFKDSIDADTDVVVTCQQEAKASLHKSGLLAESKWHHVGHGAHFGVAGKAINAQIINVFVRLDGNVTITRDPTDWEKGKDWIGENNWAGHDKNRFVAWFFSGRNTLIQESTVAPGHPKVVNDTLHAKPIRPVLRASSRLHETKGEGKGGATTYLSLSLGDKRLAELVFICAHAADQPAEERERGMMTIWEQAIGDKSPDSVFVLGDLNYRLLDHELDGLLPKDDPEGDSALVKHLFSASDRAKFKPADQLSGKVRSTLTKTEQEAGLGLECNEPFRNYMPTYRRNTEHKHACSNLNSEYCHLQQRRDIDQCTNTEENCRKQFIQAKHCERYALGCYFVGEEESAELNVEVTSGKELGFKTTLFTDDVTQRSYLMVWRVEIGAGQANIRPGFWITEIEISKPNSSEVHKPIADWKKDAAAYADSLATMVHEIDKFEKANGTDMKMKVTFEWTARKWKRKSKDLDMLQLGWLDRLCWKQMHPDVSIDLKKDKAVSNGFASDHMATHFMVEWTKGPLNADVGLELEE